MAMFGYTVYVLFCVWVTFSFVLINIVSLGLSGKSGGLILNTIFLVFIVLLWYGSYVWFPFTVALK